MVVYIRKRNQLKIWTPLAPTMPTRHGRVHTNAFMAQCPLHELHKVAQVLGQKPPSISKPIPIKCLTSDFALSWLVSTEAGLVRTEELHGEGLYQRNLFLRLCSCKILLFSFVMGLISDICLFRMYSPFLRWMLEDLRADEHKFDTHCC